MEIVYRGRLVIAKTDKTSLKLDSFKLQTCSGFSDNFVSSTKLSSKFSWKLEDLRRCVNDESGLDTVFVLVSYTTQSAGTRFCVVESKFEHGTVSRYCGNIHTPPKLESVFLEPFLEFSHALEKDYLPSCVLCYGPKVVVVNHDKVLLFHGRPSQVVEKKTFSVWTTAEKDLESTGSMPKEGMEKFSANILCSASHKNWIVIIVLISSDSKFATAVFALENRSQCKDFNIRKLQAHNFFPQDYASKVSTVSLEWCRQVIDDGSNFSYHNSCALGLNDGYVVVFENGTTQMCVSLYSDLGASNLSGAITELCFLKDFVICLTSDQNCYAINRHNNKVLQHWEGVRKPLVGDFFYRGTKQLLLLFEAGGSRVGQLGSYLLTNFQDLLLDKRGGKEESSECSDENTPASDSLGKVAAALQEQHQALSRSLAEEEARLANKERFAANLWQHLQGLSMRGSEEPQMGLPSEVPLVSIVGGAIVSTHQRAQQAPPTMPGSEVMEVKVQSVWQRLVDSMCVVGVRVLNSTHKVLKNAMIIPSAKSGTSAAVAAHSKIWQTLHRDAVQTSDPSTSGLHKRQKLSPLLHVRQTPLIQPSESVTLTCSFKVTELGQAGKVEYFVHLKYSVEDGSIPQSPERKETFTDEPANKSRQGDCGDGAGKETTEEKITVNESLREGVTQSVDHGTGVWRTVRMVPAGERRNVKFLFCGTVEVSADQVLQQELVMDAASLLDQGTEADSEVEKQLLALSAVQQSWSLHVTFLLHEATKLSAFLTNAGLWHHPHLDQYIMGKTTSPCLRLARIQLTGFLPLPARTATVQVFARDEDQLLLFLRFLYSVLPEDCTINLVSPGPHTDTQHAPHPTAAQTSHKTPATKRVKASKALSMTEASVAEAESMSVQGDSDSGPDRVRREREQFEEQMRLYRSVHL